MKTPTLVWSVPRGDSRVGRFAVRVDGVPADIAGYAITWVVRNAPTSTGDVIAQGEGVVEPAGTSALVTLSASATATVGLRYFSATATPPEASGKPGPFTYSCEIDVTDHA